MRKISVLSVFLMLSLLLTSCTAFVDTHKSSLPYSMSADEIKDIETPVTVLPDSPEKLDFGMVDTFDPSSVIDKLYFYNYNYGYITVTSASNNSSMFAKTEHFLDACVYDRNDALEEKFCFTFSSLIENNAKTVVSNVEGAKKNKTKYADLIAVSLADVKAFDGKDILCPVSSLPFVKNSSSYAINNEILSLESEFFTSSEASILPSMTRVIYFNSALLEKSGKDAPYSLLSEKKWTWNAFLEYLPEKNSLASSDDISSLVIATVRAESEAIKADAKALADKLKEVTVKDKAKEKFLAGEALFYLGTLADIVDISKSELSYGLLPIPVFSEGDSYSDVHDAKNVTVFACPQSASDIERSAFMMSAIAEVSAGSRSSAFSQIIESKLLRDNGSFLSLGYIFTADIEIIY